MDFFLSVIAVLLRYRGAVLIKTSASDKEEQISVSNRQTSTFSGEIKEIQKRGGELFDKERPRDQNHTDICGLLFEDISPRLRRSKDMAETNFNRNSLFPVNIEINNDKLEYGFQYIGLRTATRGRTKSIKRPI